MSVVLVINSGSSSFKYQIIQMDADRVLAKGLIERIGSDHGHAVHTAADEDHQRELAIPDHDAGFRVMLEACAEYGPDLSGDVLIAVGHRVVHGGSSYFEATIIDAAVEADIDDLGSLAPLHNPANLEGIFAARRAFPHVPQVAVFDTAFHQTMPPAAYTYAIDAGLAKENRIRRYGAHGISHKFVSEATAAFLERVGGDVNSIVLHIGNGASACAVRGGLSVETSMGMTPLEGLVMGTRSGDIDPAVLIHLHRRAGSSFDELDDLLNRRSGMLGLTGSSDLRDVQAAARDGDKRADAAIDVYCHRIKHYVGAYYAQLGHVDAIVFTAGVGENSPEIRARSLSGLTTMGIEIDPILNEVAAHGSRRISTVHSAVQVLVIPTNEELEIARQSLSVVS